MPPSPKFHGKDGSARYRIEMKQSLAKSRDVYSKRRLMHSLENTDGSVESSIDRSTSRSPQPEFNSEDLKRRIEKQVRN